MNTKLMISPPEPSQSTIDHVVLKIKKIDEYVEQFLSSDCVIDSESYRDWLQLESELSAFVNECVMWRQPDFLLGKASETLMWSERVLRYDDLKAVRGF